MWPSTTFYKILLAAQILPCFFCKKKRAEVKEKESPLTPWAFVIWAAQPSSPPPPVASLLSVHPTQRPCSLVATEPCRRPRQGRDKGDVPSTPRAPRTHSLSLDAPSPLSPSGLAPFSRSTSPRRTVAAALLRHRVHRALLAAPMCPRAPQPSAASSAPTTSRREPPQRRIRLPPGSPSPPLLTPATATALLLLAGPSCAHPVSSSPSPFSHVGRLPL